MNLRKLPLKSKQENLAISRREGAYRGRQNNEDENEKGNKLKRNYKRLTI